MILYAEEALAQIEALRLHYERKERIEAIIGLKAALSEAEVRIERDSGAGLPAPRPYPALARPGRFWIIVRPYWIAYRAIPELTILAVFHETADIPSRLRNPD